MGAIAPVGNHPPLSAMTLRPVTPTSVLPFMTRKTMPMMRKATRANTLMSANQNSISPNTFTETRFRDRTTASATSAITHCGTDCSGSQYCDQNFTYRATAVTSTIEVNAQFRKYSQPAVYAIFSP